MKFLIVAAVLFVAAVQVQSFILGRDGYGYDSGRTYGDRGYQGGRQGYNNEGHHNNILNNKHDDGHSVNDYDATVHKHQVSDHNAGETTGVNNGGHRNGAYGDYQSGHDRYGNNFDNRNGY